MEHLISSVHKSKIKIYVISLKHTPERYEKIKVQLEERGLSFEKFEAIDGRDLNITLSEKIKFQGKDLMYKNKNFIIGKTYEISTNNLSLSYHAEVDVVDRLMTAGELGCYFSHYSLYKTIIEENIKYALIFEDDSILKENFSLQLSNLLKNLPKTWDIIFLYTTNIAGKIEYLDINNPNIFKIGINSHNIVGLGAYIVSYNGAIKLAKCTKSFSGPIDEIISVFITRGVLETYIVPDYLIQSPFRRNIEDSIIAQMGRKHY